jgi:hypothetical protein
VGKSEEELYLDLMREHGHKPSDPFFEEWSELSERQRGHYRKQFPGFVKDVGDLISDMSFNRFEVEDLRRYIVEDNTAEALKMVKDQLDAEDKPRAKEVLAHLTKMWIGHPTSLREISAAEVQSISLDTYLDATERGEDTPHYLVRRFTEMFITPAIQERDYGGKPCFSNGGRDRFPIEEAHQIWAIEDATQAKE